MKEHEFIETIKKLLNSEHIGDDCAYLQDLGIVVTQDSLVEGIHFSLDFATPYQLGYKSAMVNLSDICASGGKPLYILVSLSLPKNITKEFIEEFYKGLKDACGTVEIVGGDITGSDKIFISITAIGSTSGRRISSRANAQIGQAIVVSGEHGSSGAGLKLLKSGNKEGNLVTAHLMPVAQCEYSSKIASQITEDYAMMDTSDGLMDALSAIAVFSGVCMSIDFDKIPFNTDLKEFPNYKDLIFFGGEDYQLVATVPTALAADLGLTVIGEVLGEKTGVLVNQSIDVTFYTRGEIEEKLFNHFEGEKQ